MAPWNWMWDTDLFGVQNLQNNEIGYCCILGRAGKFFGLAVYLGTEGLLAYKKILRESETAENSIDLFYYKKCLVTSFVGKMRLSDNDLEIIKKLGLTFKGRNAYPLFRKYEPGYYPWYLDEDEVSYLIHCHNQAMVVAKRFKENPRMLEPPEIDKYFVRVPVHEDGRIVWKDVWLSPHPLKQIVYSGLDELWRPYFEVIERPTSTRMVWEIDYFYSPIPICKNDMRPYFPKIFMCVDQNSFFVLGMHIMHPLQSFEEEFVKFMTSVLKEQKIIPAKILVQRYEIRLLLEPLAKNFNIDLRESKRLNALECAHRDMVRFFRKGKNRYPEVV